MEILNKLGSLNTHRKHIYGSHSFLETQDLINLSQPLFTLRKKNTLAHQGKPFQGLYVVQCGTLKQIIQHENKKELISHFFLPGDIIGLDAIGEGNYCGTISTIETSGLYHIPFRTIDELPISHSSHMQLLRCLSRAIYLEHSRMWQMISQPSDVRLACFFIMMSCKFSALGYSPHCFRLAMSRKEIADYLCMAIETLSRLVSRFQQQGILSAHGHEYCLLNPTALAAIAERKK
ncbi:helix-turn-helix domain-containing protein [Halomonas sp. 707B3]|uniref:helix-turn-helix domain-containing protein n=2 Tax=Halomonadaceae TaxID=28256 RepID=UPI0020A0AC28|nr:helix-turn-helix domain-containing protein [Halomonas sp. 707B3]MCP1317562.1 helix-turn-helix domain-containing protein [Halomonas sp. 707B3]